MLFGRSTACCAFFALWACLFRRNPLHLERMNFRHLLLLLLCCMALSCCIHEQRTQVLSNVPLSRSLKVAVDGYYVRPEPEKKALPARGTIYVAPMDVSRVKGADEDTLSAMQQAMHRYLCDEVAAALKDVCPNGEWVLTDDAEHATLLYQTALVRFRAQKPMLRGLAVLAGPFVSVPFVSGAVKRFAKGDICIEGAVRIRETDTLLAAFKDSNRESTALYEAAAYRPTGNAEVNLRIWAKKMARFIYADARMNRDGKSFEQLLEERSVGDTIQAYME